MRYETQLKLHSTQPTGEWREYCCSIGSTIRPRQQVPGVVSFVSTFTVINDIANAIGTSICIDNADGKKLLDTQKIMSAIN
ncbi:hypothetical protein ACE1CD_20680 [Aerosakkonema sp. BLCC-F183]|uniref:hypothetical protein n=1 Tax=Aerosakkonema sp. BLCC-F183 TaxID=3342834 RepID=UPI0035B75290